MSNQIMIPMGSVHCTVDVEDARKAVAEFDVKQAEKEKLYDGYTLDQWQTIIDGKFLCEFWESESFAKFIDTLHSVAGNIKPFAPMHSPSQKHCRPAQLYGVRHPCFGKRPEWLKDDDRIIYAVYGHAGASTYGRNRATDVGWKVITEFIAMPSE